jgi:hypothetical protein
MQAGVTTVPKAAQRISASAQQRVDWPIIVLDSSSTEDCGSNLPSSSHLSHPRLHVKVFGL